MSLPSLISTIHAYGLNAKKSLGQHFLLDENITAKVAHCGGDLSACTVIEIGPGPGGLTRALLAANACEVVAIEKDARCIAALEELSAAYPGRLRIIAVDAMDAKLAELTPAPRKIIANLPYNVGTIMLMQWLEDIAQDASAYQSMTLMFQREVAERIAAAPDTKEYGRVSVMAQWLCHVRYEFELPPGAFSPPPKVYSSVITLTPREVPLASDWHSMQKVVAAGFGNRRKMLRQSLKTSGVNAEEILQIAVIAGDLRAEVLSVEQFHALAMAYKQLTNG